MNLRNAISILVIVFLIGFISQKSIKNYYPHNDFAETKNGIQLLILPEYETYYLGQSVWVKVKLINRSDKKLMLKYPIASMYFDFVIKDYERNVLPKGWIACDTHPENDTAFLAPHKDTTFIFSLVMFFPGGETMNESTNGVYTISTSFNGISSNEAEINFINPVGKEKEIRNQYYNSKIHSDITDGINDYKLVFNQNPTSRFIPQFFNKVLVESFSHFDEPVIKDLYYNYFEKNCNKYGSGHIVGLYVMFLNNLGVSNEGKVKELNMLSTKYKNSALEILLQQEISNIKNN